ncbi:hypothetical protein FRB94_013471 [Tulasnella sp. JGI-2019a]|nr:hypothetical protein FRB93_002321 [Tulasnella sp. JGI-2019a]KAG9008309.1 hypothetical protein FRB94_013471 [Tulasnella sp. JGI-2019a]KAG9028955.1 hypothetical protein FRB95_005870 [Tulasnella sp. JGI-2019a]
MASRNHEYCCCAIPTMNVGIYLTIIEQLSVGLLAGVLAVATTPIVGASTPSFAPWLFAAGCFVVSAVQAMGFFGIFKEKATLFQRYVQINSLAVSYVFGISATWIVISATRHTTATNACITNFYTNTTTNTTGIGGGADATAGEGQTVCNIFVWADIGIMGGLWLLMFIFQGYLILLTQWYSSTQRADHEKYYSVYSVEAPQGIPLGERQRIGDAWDPRPSTESWSGGGTRSPGAPEEPRAMYRDHQRQLSDITERNYGNAEPPYSDQEPKYGYSDAQPGFQQRRPSEGVVEAGFSPRSPPRSPPQGTPPFSLPPAGALHVQPYPDDYEHSGGYVPTAPYTQYPRQNYAESTAPSYQTHEQQQYGRR